MTEPNQATNLMTTTTTPQTRIAIIGAGLTGLITAALLEHKFAELGLALTTDIFEKSAGVGRLTTRYKKPEPEQQKQYQFEFGAQYFTAKSTEFQEFITPWVNTGTLTPWHAKVATINLTENGSDDITATEQWGDKQPRYISCPKMTSWGRALARELNQTMLHYKTRVAPLNDPDQDQSPLTRLFDIDGNALGRFDWVICTAPTVQASELLANTSFQYKENIAQTKMLACYTLMLGWQDSSRLPNSLIKEVWDILEVVEPIEETGASSSLGGSRVFVEHNKPNREGVLSSVTIHVDNDWSEQHVDKDVDSVKIVLLAKAKQILDWDEYSEPDHVDCHRWRYAATAQDSQSAPNLLLDTRKQWIVSGDWCGGGRIESCFEMAALSVAAIAPTY